MSEHRYPAGHVIPVINRERCEGKGPCVEVCPYDVFAIQRLTTDMRAQLSLVGKLKGFVHGWQQAVVIAPDECRACGLCVTACPEQAIRLSRNEPGA